MNTDIARLIQGLLAPGEPPLQSIGWRPAADVYRVRDGWLVKFDLAGVRPEDVEVSREEREDGTRGIVAGRVSLPQINATNLAVRVGEHEIQAQIAGGASTKLVTCRRGMMQTCPQHRT